MAYIQTTTLQTLQNNTLSTSKQAQFRSIELSGLVANTVLTVIHPIGYQLSSTLRTSVYKYLYVPLHLSYLYAGTHLRIWANMRSIVQSIVQSRSTPSEVHKTQSKLEYTQSMFCSQFYEPYAAQLPFLREYWSGNTTSYKYKENQYECQKQPPYKYDHMRPQYQPPDCYYLQLNLSTAPALPESVCIIRFSQSCLYGVHVSNPMFQCVSKANL